MQMSTKLRRRFYLFLSLLRFLLRISRSFRTRTDEIISWLRDMISVIAHALVHVDRGHTLIQSIEIKLIALSCPLFRDGDRAWKSMQWTIMLSEREKKNESVMKMIRRERS